MNNSRPSVGMIGKKEAPFLVYFKLGEQYINLELLVPACHVIMKEWSGAHTEESTNEEQTEYNCLEYII